MTQSDRNAAPPKKAFLYAREGKCPKVTGKAVKSQFAKLRRYARSHGLEVAGEFADNYSATKRSRPGFRNLIASVAAHSQESAIVVLDINRLTRNVKDWVTIADLNVPVHLVNESKIVSRESSNYSGLSFGLRILIARQAEDQLTRWIIQGR